MEEVDDAEEKDEPEEDCCISIVVFELITFSWDTDVFAEKESYDIIKHSKILKNFLTFSFPSSWEGVLGRLVLFLFDIFSENL